MTIILKRQTKFVCFQFDANKLLKRKGASNIEKIQVFHLPEQNFKSPCAGQVSLSIISFFGSHNFLTYCVVEFKSSTLHKDKQMV